MRPAGKLIMTSLGNYFHSKNLESSSRSHAILVSDHFFRSSKEVFSSFVQEGSTRHESIDILVNVAIKLSMNVTLFKHSFGFLTTLIEIWYN